MEHIIEIDTAASAAADDHNHNEMNINCGHWSQ